MKKKKDKKKVREFNPVYAVCKDCKNVGLIDSICTVCGSYLKDYR